MRVYFKRKVLTGILIMLSLAISGAQAKEIIRYSKVDDVKLQSFNKALEESLIEAIRSYDDIRVLVRAKSRLRQVERYEVVEQYENIPNAVGFSATVQPIVPIITSTPPQLKQPSNAVTQNSNDLDIPLPGAPSVANTANQSEPEPPPTDASEASVLRYEIERLRQTMSKQAELLRQLQQPPQTERQRVTTQTRLISQRTEVERLQLTVWVPNTLEDYKVTFIEDLVKEKANLNFIRGDALQIIPTAFPEKKLAEEKKTVEQNEAPPVPIAAPSVAATTTTTNIPAALVFPDNVIHWASTLESWVWVLVVLFLLWLLFSWLRGRRKPPIITAEYYDETRQDQRAQQQPLLAPSYAALPGAASLDASSHFLPSPETAQLERTKSLNEEITSMVVLNEKLLKESLIQAPSNVDKSKFDAYLLHTLGRDVFTKFSDNALNETAFEQTVQQLEELEKLNSAEKENLAKMVHSGLRKKETQMGMGHSSERPFAFLNKLSDQQVIYLLSQEEAQSKALILSQMDQARSAGVLGQLNSKEQGEIAISMGLLESLPLTVYQDVANYLARKAQNIPDFNQINIDGDEVLIKTLEAMDVAGEASVLNALKEKNPEQYFRIKRVYMNFSDMIYVPESALKNFLREIERETLAFALYDEDDAFKDKLLSTLPDRSRALTAQVISNLKDPGTVEIMRAKKAISRIGRQLLKAKAFALEIDLIAEEVADKIPQATLPISEFEHLASEASLADTDLDVSGSESEEARPKSDVDQTNTLFNLPSQDKQS